MSDVETRIREVIEQNHVVLFMKGDRAMPMCGFSAAVVEILTSLGLEFEAVNVLADPEVRQGIKAYSDWPTLPQLYVGGRFVGGCDIVQELHASGELHEIIRGSSR